ncbi:tRNA (adenosine(37)-N6)-threonylcarbamoyltransferase complex ATPase subunit type 1 TsaE [Croceicoccus marinus]|uniref:tRNA threonylcarbamoyladenosine biosynthesis protein TsaE n=1 Tax=Croceicoccus marinus TaxID=450378 RepID=A0A1Z1F9I3_9SPHN|nr:tRNA (adenosine(37)-N6)-threonylcarbamoyltransferase complex ATPase subunit type 1 TsaE [Croceicoccus marinus]ARU15347.1 tRNA (adenosine(37)-N6)-threonylcarbamoyltransferase complex ATPase subunit type 1 TsaE [Croceicoccus marinus]
MSSETRHPLPDLAATQALGTRIAGLLRAGDVVALSGGLGAGKTTLARAIIAALGHAGEVPSPTFAIIQTYDPAPDGSGVALPLVHADFYRLEDPAEAEELGLDDYLQDAALIAEWPEMAGGFAHDPACLAIHIETSGDCRIAIARAGHDWLERWG